MFVSAVAGMLLTFSWLQNRSIDALGIWGGAYLLSTAAMTLLVVNRSLPNEWVPLFAYPMWAAGHGLMWKAARSFEGRCGSARTRARPLTGVANRRAFFERGEALLHRAQSDRRAVALLMFDLDRFKRVNDTFGHQTGDRVLAKFCEVARAELRPDDLFGRFWRRGICLPDDRRVADRGGGRRRSDSWAVCQYAHSGRRGGGHCHGQRRRCHHQ
jgi:GGDEF domain-containing protein